MRTTPVLLFIVLALAGANAQPMDTSHYKIRGHVLDADSTGVPFAEVKIVAFLETSTDQHGFFSFTIPNRALEKYAVHGGVDKVLAVTKKGLIMYEPPDSLIRLPYRPALQARFTIRMAKKGSPVFLRSEKLMLNWLEERIAVETQSFQDAAAKRDVLAEAARRYGLEKADVEQAFAQYKERLRSSTDLYKRGLAALDDANEARQASLRIAKLDTADRLFEEVILKDEAAIAAGEEAKKRLPDAWYAKGLVLFNKASYAGARVCFANADSLRPGDSKFLNMLGCSLYELALHDRALEHFQQAYTIVKLKFGTNHPKVATRLNNIAVVYHSKGEYDRALDLHTEALNIDKGVFGPRHPNVARDLNNIAGVYDSIGEYEHALELYREALKIDKAYYGENHHKIGIRLNNIAMLYHEQGNTDHALDLCRQAAHIAIEYFGRKHPEVAARLNNIAGIYYSQDSCERALEHFLEALIIFEAYYGRNLPKVAASLSNIGGVFVSQGSYDDALELYQEALQIDQEYYGRNHPKVAKDLNNMASVHESERRYKKALELYEQALEIIVGFKGEEHPQTITVKKNKDYVRFLSWAKSEYQKIQTQVDLLLLLDSTEVKTARDSLALLNAIAVGYTKQQKADSALLYLEPAATLAQRLNHRKMIGTILNNTGSAHKQLQNWATAEKLLLESIAFNRREFGDSAAVLAYSCFHLAGVYSGTGKAPAAGRELLANARVLAAKHELRELLEKVNALEQQWTEE